jgi:quinol monooxygenase YgiN
MTEAVHWVLATKIKDGKYEDLVALMNEMVTATETDEPGTTHYEWFVNDGKDVCHVYERYESSAATMVHLGNFDAKFAKRFMGCLEPTGMTVYGNPDETVRKALATMGAVHMDFLGGFSR